MGATKIMIIRHAEKPGSYGDPAISYDGVDPSGTYAGSEAGAEHLVTGGWQRAGGLVSLFAPLLPGAAPRKPFAVPQTLFAANPGEVGSADSPSKRPFETLSGVAAATGLTIDTSFKKKDFAAMVQAALDAPGVVLIAWQHDLIPLIVTEKDKTDGNTPAQPMPGICAEILSLSRTPPSVSKDWGIPQSWPDLNGRSRYDLVFVFERPSGEGSFTGFSLEGQYLLAGDAAP